MKHLPASLFVGAILSAPAFGTMVAISASDAGFFNEAGRSSKNDGLLLGAPPATFNYSTGTIAEVPPLSGSDVPRRNYFTFDLSGIDPGTIVSAGLSLYLPADGFSSPDPSETYELAGVPAASPGEMTSFASGLTAIYDIGDPGSLGSAMTIYSILDSGPGGFGTATVGESDEDSMISLPIAAPGLGYLNMFAGGPTVLTGAVSTLDLGDATDEVVFGFTAPLISGVVSPDPDIPESLVTPTPVLMLEVVPEPALGTLALVGAAFMLRRRSRCRRR